MKILFLGDIVGRNARDEIAAQLPGIRKAHAIDCVIINAENAAHGFGITAQICDDLFKAGADCLTTGNHVWDQREIMGYIDRSQKVLRPLNYPEGTPGRGATVIETARGEKILVANIMARLFMDALDDPFAAAEKLCRQYRLGQDVQAIFVDFHGEASSEKTAMGYHLDGRVSCVVGTHTHVPTADARVLPQGTGFQTDAGMCGSYDSVIGMEASLALHRFVRKIPGEKLRPAEGPVTLCGIIADIDSSTGLCRRIEPFRMGGVLRPSVPATA
jgi:metallophosphoesterase (TIGR00282 family)